MPTSNVFGYAILLMKLHKLSLTIVYGCPCLVLLEPHWICANWSVSWYTGPNPYQASCYLDMALQVRASLDINVVTICYVVWMLLKGNENITWNNWYTLASLCSGWFITSTRWTTTLGTTFHSFPPLSPTTTTTQNSTLTSDHSECWTIGTKQTKSSNGA